MATGPGDSMLGAVSRLLEAQAASDRALLARFGSTGNGEAFRVLVERHGPMVLGACRRILHNEQDAEDAFQAAFLVLARKAGTIHLNESLGPWLYVVACRVAQKHRATIMRRRELPIAELPTAAPVLPDDLRGVLDEELGRLPEKFRSPMVLCYLQGKTNTEAAEELGCSKGTVSGWLARGREMLRK